MKSGNVHFHLFALEPRGDTQYQHTRISFSGSFDRVLDHSLGEAWIRPDEFCNRLTIVLEVLHAQVVSASGFERYLPGSCFVWVAGPCLNQKFPIDIQARAIVSRESECVLSGLSRCELTGPANREIVFTYFRRWFVTSPIEIDARICSHSRCWSTQLLIIEILSLQSVAQSRGWNCHYSLTAECGSRCEGHFRLG